MRHSPNVCALFLGKETPVTANPENHQRAWPGALEAEMPELGRPLLCCTLGAAQPASRFQMPWS